MNTPRALGDSSDDNARPESLPTTVELAQSFLQAEPPKERAEIKAAVADSQSIDQSETLSESTEDIDVLGVGGGISLPGFLADFLKGVVDRIQFTIGDFHLNLNTRIDLPADVSDSQEHSIKWENLTIRLSVERVDIDGITDQGSKPGSADGATESKPRVGEGANSRFRRAARRISLRNAQGMLISDTSLFANLSRVSMPSSPYATQSSTSKASDGRHHALNSKSGSNSSSPLSCRPKLRSALKTKSAERPGIPPTEITNVRPQDSMTDIAEYVRATTTGEHVSDSDFQSQYQDSVFTGSFYSDLGAIPASSYDSRGFVSGSDLSPLFSEGRTVVHESPAGYQAPAIASLGKSSPSPDNNTNNTYQTGSAGENLAESKIYSHEEAQSMYMSAMSQRSHQGDISYRNIPGNWDSSSSDDEISEPRVGVPTEPPIDQAQSASLTTPASSELKCIPSEIRDSPEPRQQIEGPKIKSPITPKPDAGLPAVANTSPVEQASSDKCESNSDTSDTVFLTVKNFLSINSITLDIPMNDHCVTDASKPLPQSHQSDSAKIPGSFSATSHQTSSQDGGQSGIALGLLQPSNTALAFGEEALKSSTSMLLEDVTILGDIGLTKLSGLLIQRLMDLNKQSPDKEKAIDPPAEVPSWTEIAVRRISWKFLDLVKGVTVPESHIAKFEAQVAEMPDDMDVLLQASVRDFQITVDREDYLTVLNSSIKKLTFGYAGDNIMAFDSGLKMRESNRDVLGPIDHDVILKVSQSLERTHIELTTLPLHIYLDLRRLDETFNWFGGFSGILGLGSSVISTVTVKESRAKAFTGAARPRGVHFENALQDVNQSASSRNVKLTARLGGIVFDVEGSSSTLGIETSAVKMVSRAEGVGLSVDRLNISGPYIASQRQEPSVKVRLSGLRAEYLNNPREIDLTRLLALLCPSKDNYDQDDDILVDTLLRQRRQGAVVRINADQLDTYINDIDDLKQLPALGEDLKKLSTVAKYLPEDDRPGIMTLMLLRSGMMELDTGSALGVFRLSAKGTEIAHISLPSLLALSMIEIELRRNGFEELIGVPLGTRSETDRSSPMIMTRYIGNELRPIVKLKLSGVRVEYHLATITAALGLSEEVGSERFMSDMVSSIATVTALPDVRRSPADLSIQALSRPEDSKLGTPPLGLDIVLKDVLLGLNPRDCPSRGIFLLSQAHIILAPSQDGELTVTFEMDKSAFLAVDDVGSLHSNPGSPSLIAQDTLTKSLLAMGYVSLSEISAAKVSVNLLKFGPEGGTSIDAELRDALVVLESCADSTQTMQSILNGLQPPSPPTKHQKYRTEIMPVEDMLASFSGEAFPAKQAAGGASHGLPDESPEANDEDGQDLEFVSSFYEADPFGEDGTMSDSMLEASLESLPDLPSQSYTEDQKPLITSPDHVQIDTDESTLDFREDHFGNSSKIGGTAHRWDTKRNTYDLADDSRLRTSPFRVRVRGVHIIWNLFDGYDWQHTRDTIDQAVTAVEDKAAERRSNRNKRRSLDVEEDEDSVIGDFLFNSIYIGISGKQDPKDLTRQINRNIDDLVSETESYATFASSNSPSRKGGAPRAHKRKLRLMRSKSHKLTFEVKGLSVDMVAFPPGSGETQNSIDVRVQDLEIFDHLPSSTWKKFATYMHDAGERESGSSMVHLEILNVKPVPDLAASEIILKVRHPISYYNTTDLNFRPPYCHCDYT